jgi:hypothetical protein
MRVVTWGFEGPVIGNIFDLSAPLREIIDVIHGFPEVHHKFFHGFFVL